MQTDRPMIASRASTSQRSVADLIAERGAREGSRVAFATGKAGETMSYGELAGRARAWYRALAERGIGTGQRVALLIADPLAFTAAYLSLLGARVTVVPLSPDLGPEEAAARLAQLHATLAVTDRTLGGALPCPVWRLEAGAPERSAGPHPEPHGGAFPEAGPAVLLTSSGTTGIPKVVPLAEDQMLYVAHQVAAHHGLGEADRGYCPLPLFHVNAQVVGVLSTLVSGGGLVLDRRFHRTGFWELMEEWQVTWCNLVPAILAILSRGNPPAERTARRIRFARSAAAPLPTAVLGSFESRCGVSVLETYGMSEAASQIAANPLDALARRPGSVGMPVGARVQVVDEERRPCRTGETGSVEIRGRSVVHEYVVPGSAEQRRPAREADGWLVTGDLGFHDPDGFLHLTGRADDVINRGGEKVFPREIEDVLRTHPEVVEVAVAGQTDPILGQCPVAYVVARGHVEPALLAGHLQDLSASRLVPAKRPVRLLVVDALPAGPTGKISRRRLADEAALAVRARLPLEAHAL
jgi:acyl-CoA synthetase (AMP-forming)/AMP-acid ligase II